MIGGVAAKDQLAALEQGVCDTYSYSYPHPQKTKNIELVLITVNQIVEICFLIACHFSCFFSWCHLIIRLTLWWEHLVDWTTSFPLGN